MKSAAAASAAGTEDDSGADSNADGNSDSDDTVPVTASAQNELDEFLASPKSTDSAAPAQPNHNR